MDAPSHATSRRRAFAALLRPLPAIALALALVALILGPCGPRQVPANAAPALSPSNEAARDVAEWRDQLVIIAVSPADVVYMAALVSAEAELRNLLGEQQRHTYLIEAPDRATADAMAKLVIEDVGHFTSAVRLDAVIVDRHQPSKRE